MPAPPASDRTPRANEPRPDRYYLHGTTWHPVMGPFGPMDCVNCVCKYGRIECQRLECPSRSALSCERPVKVAGRCCPVCPLVDGEFPVQFAPSRADQSQSGDRR